LQCALEDCLPGGAGKHRQVNPRATRGFSRSADAGLKVFENAAALEFVTYQTQYKSLKISTVT
jgi:hypothetical protein